MGSDRMYGHANRSTAIDPTPRARATSRRSLILGSANLVVTAAMSPAWAQAAAPSFAQWVERFQVRARARGVSDATYARVMASLKPDTSVYALDKAQPEFREKVWQYLNRRVSDWRIRVGRERIKEHAGLLERIERTYGVDRYIMMGLWGMESAFGDVIENPKHMRPVLPALAALAWGEPRRRSYWEAELLNALVIVERGWGTPDKMIGSWAGAMGHTQWMPEVWLNMGLDFNGDGRISPFGPPDDALAGTAQYLVKRGGYRRGEGWGYEVRVPQGISTSATTLIPITQWIARGITQANGKPFPRPNERAHLWQPLAGGPTFLLTQNFKAVRAYNPASTYALAIVHLGDRIRGDGPLVQNFPGGERILTLEEIQEVQRRLTQRGFDTGGTDGRLGRDSLRAVQAFQKAQNMQPADGYPGLAVLNRLRSQ